MLEPYDGKLSRTVLRREGGGNTADPADYAALVHKFNGQVVKISSSSTNYINPMDINLNYSEDDNPVALKADFILSLCELIMGSKDGLQPIEKTVIDRCVHQIYQRYFDNPAPENMPILEDLYDALLKQDEKEAHHVATALEIYVKGSLKLFNNRTNVDDLDEINHNPYELAAYLTVKFEDYTRDEVQATLQWLFEQQYELTLTEVVEIRTRTTSSTDPETGETTTEEEDYEYYILNVKLRNKGLNSVISNSGLSEDDMERYRILLQTRGNRPDIFGNDIYATPGGEYTDYDIPGEALTDTRFANMIREAEKYLGYPYVWGGSSPSTSFDCSGFVSYVINHCGNGWSVGRLTANGLMGVCDIIPKSSAKPGDLIFFQGTYDTSGASHVGIYVGNGMMIHCGNPISYASIESNYWQQHFYCFGRIRN